MWRRFGRTVAVAQASLPASSGSLEGCVTPSVAGWPTAALLISLALIPSAAAAESVRMTDGREVTGRIVVLNATQATVQRQDGPQAVPLTEIARITLADAPAANPLAGKGQPVVWTDDGGCLAVRDVTVRNGRLRAVTDVIGPVDLPLDRVARVLRPSASETPGQLEQALRQLGPVGGQEDTLVVRAPDGKWVPMNGVLVSLAQGQVAFSYEGTETTMKDDAIAILVLAGTRRTDARPATGGQVTGVDGSRLVFKTILFDDRGIALEGASLGALRLRREGVAEIRFWREGTAFLSDLTPTEVRQTPFFDDEFPWQKDRSVSGLPLVLNGATYEKGLGLHAQCRMAFDLRGEFRRLSAVAGIDDELRAGRATLTILADGKPVVDRLLLDRTKAPEKVDLDLRGVRTLTILVGFAEGTFGNGARVNLCDAVLTK